LGGGDFSRREGREESDGYKKNSGGENAVPMNKLAYSFDDWIM
jgi:hypothetical protein